MPSLTEHERKVLGLIRKNPEVVADKKARRELASRMGLSEKTLRNRIADFKRYGLIQERAFTTLEEESSIEVRPPLSIQDEAYVRDSKSPGYTAPEWDLFYYVRYVLKWRKTIISNVVIFSALAVAVSFMMPKTFEATSVLMPPSSEQTKGMLEMLSNLPFRSLGLQTEISEAMTLLAILKSRTIMEKVVNAFDLITLYDVESVEEAVNKLEKNASFREEDEGTIRIRTQYSTGWLSGETDHNFARGLVADMANRFVSELDKKNKELKTEKARFQRMFIEERYKENMRDMAKAEEKLKVFQEEHKMIALPEQMAAAIEAAAAMKAQLISDQVKLKVMTSTLNPDHPEIERTRQQIGELSLQLEQMDKGSEKDILFPTFAEVPDLGIQLARLSREVEIQNALFTFLTQQYEEAKIQEAKDTPTVQVLDIAKLPERPARPRKLFIVVSTALASFLLSMLSIGLVERFRLSK